MSRLHIAGHVCAVVTLTAALLTAVFVGSASACSCLPGNEAERYHRADHVFTAKVVSETLEPGKPEDPYDDKNRYAVHVRKAYKGDVHKRVDVVSLVNGGLCGRKLSVGETYLVFAHGDAGDRRVETNWCSGTRLASGGPPSTAPTSTTTTPTCVTPAP